MSSKIWQRIFSVLLLAGMLMGLVQPGSVRANAPEAPAVQTAEKIEGYLLDQFAAQGSADFVVRFTEQADLSAAYSMDWEARGEFVYNTLTETARQAQATAKGMLDAMGLEYKTFIAGNDLYVYNGNLDVAETLAGLPEVSDVYAARTYYIDPVVIESPLASVTWAGDLLARKVLTGVGASPDALAWGISYTNADQFWTAFGVQGDGMVVANIDTGVQWNHPALDQAFKCGGNPADPACWADPSNICGGSACDNNGHGTHTMGTMVGDDDPALTWQAGMAPNAQWIACKGCESSSCSDTALNACADWILAPDGNPANRPNVVNNSWGGGGGDTWYLAKVQAWVAAGVFPAFSAGNAGSGCSTLGSPGDYQESFGSAAHDSAGTIAGFSSRGPSAFGHDPYTKPNIASPGVSVCSSIPTNGWSCGYSGTSMASPHTAGAVALLWSCNPGLVGQIDTTFQVLQDNAAVAPAGNCGAPPDGEGNYTFGYGYLDVYAAGLLNCGDAGYLDGTVTDVVTGNPIEGATVTAAPALESDNTIEAVTDPNGYYQMTLLVGTYDVTADHPQFTSVTIPGVVVTIDTTTTLDIEMAPDGLLFGFVTDADNGFPLDGATVEADDGSTANTDPTGYYEMYLDEGTYALTATMQDYAPGFAVVDMISGTNTQQDFALVAAIAFVPSPAHITVTWQSMDTLPATLYNRMLTPYDFEFAETPGGFIPMLAEQPEYELAPSIPAEVTTGLAPADYVPTVGVSGGTPEGPWQGRTALPFATMDNVYVDYEGMGYLVGGYGAAGQVGIYNPDSNSWTAGATEPAPQIAYTVDACLGQNASGEGVIVLFNDTTSGATTLHRYNIATNTWDTPPVPAGFPGNGLWAHDTVSLLRFAGQNVCYISGGATTPGGGNTSALYEYHPDTNTVVNLGNFNYLAGGFAFHASWFVPWIGADGAVCVGGGVNSGSTVSNGTQCYDIAAGVFNAANADLGTMPSGLWGMADDVLYEGGDYQLWVSNGADAGFALWPNSAYYSENSGTWVTGPTPPTTVYRVEGTNIAAADGCSFYVGGGSTGGFTPSTGHNRNFSAECPPTAGVDVPWLGEVPITGTVPASGTLDAQGMLSVTLLFTATTAVGVDQPGDYYATLRVQGDPALQVPVTMTVLPDADMGQLHGYVLDNCTLEPVEALVSITSGDPITETTSDPDTGYYSAWLFSGSYDTNFSAPGYLDHAETVDIPAGGEVLLDVHLVPDRPCMDTNPDMIEVWVLTGTAVYTDALGLTWSTTVGKTMISASSSLRACRCLTWEPRCRQHNRRLMPAMT
jgi:hypothetical protein